MSRVGNAELYCEVCILMMIIIIIIIIIIIHQILRYIYMSWKLKSRGQGVWSCCIYKNR